MTNTPLDPDALEASAIALTADPEYWREERSERAKEYFRAKAKRAVSAYLAVAQPEVNDG